MRSDRERLFDILEAVERIEAQAIRGRAAFADDELAQTVRRPRSGCGRLVWLG